VWEKVWHVRLQRPQERQAPSVAKAEEEWRKDDQSCDEGWWESEEKWQEGNYQQEPRIEEEEEAQKHREEPGMEEEQKLGQETVMEGVLEPEEPEEQAEDPEETARWWVPSGEIDGLEM